MWDKNQEVDWQQEQSNDDGYRAWSETIEQQNREYQDEENN